MRKVVNYHLKVYKFKKRSHWMRCAFTSCKARCWLKPFSWKFHFTVSYLLHNLIWVQTIYWTKRKCLIHEVTGFWLVGIQWYMLIIYFYVCNVIFQGRISITQQAFNNFNPCSLFSVVQQHIVHVLLRQKISSMLLVKIMSWSIWSFFNIKPSQKTQLYFLSLMFLRYI